MKTVWVVMDLRSRFFELYATETAASIRCAELNERCPVRMDSRGRDQRYSVSEIQVQS